MKKSKDKPTESQLEPKSRTAVRGKYFNQLGEGTNLAIIEPELHAHFPDSESVNRALRAFLDIQERLKSAAPAPRAQAA